jgi:hypothetical protein
MTSDTTNEPVSTEESGAEAYKRFAAYFTPAPGGLHVCLPASMKQLGGNHGSTLMLRCQGCRRRYVLEKDSDVAQDWGRIRREQREGKFAPKVEESA